MPRSRYGPSDSDRGSPDGSLRASRVETIDVPSENWDDKVSEFVRLLMPDGLCTVERVAEHLGCNRRTMHRHLFENGTSFSEILDAERAALATSSYVRS